MKPSTVDIVLLFAARIVRLFAYGCLSVVLALYLAEIGLTSVKIGVLFGLTLLGDAVISLGITAVADRIGRRRMLRLGAALMLLAGGVFALTRNTFVLMFTAVVGVISPTGNEIGPFLAIEQASLAQLLPGDRRTMTFAWYNLAGSLATALGALAAGWLVHVLQVYGGTVVQSYRGAILVYACGGVLLFIAFASMSPNVEVASTVAPAPLTIGLHRSRRVVTALSGLFALDAFAGGLVIQSMIAYWFHVKYNLDVSVIGSIFFGANVLAGVSALFAARIAAHIGLINTMVFTHLPSNVLLCLVPLMPSLPLAVGVLLVRFSISQMDVPARQAYAMAVVDPDERSAGAGVMAIARSIGASVSPAISGALLANPLLFGAPFFIAGGLKILYDLLLYHNFHALIPPEE